MVNSEEWFLMQGGQCSPGDGAHHEGSHQAWCHCRRDRIEVGSNKTCIFQGLLYECWERFNVPARGNLWNDPTPLRVLLNLRGDAMGQHRELVALLTEYGRG
jgi:hypothetical protein